MSVLNNLNLFGFPIGFKSKDDFKFNNSLSVFLSVCIIITTLVMSGLFGLELINRSNPLVTISKKRIEKNETIIFLKDVPIKFYFENENFEAIKNISSYFNITLSEFEVTENFDFLDPVVYTDVLRKFNSSTLKQEYKAIEEIVADGEDLYDIDFKNLFVKDALAKPDSRSINININLCDSNIDSCKNYFNEFSTLKVYFDSFENYIDPLRYFDSVTRTYRQYLFELGQNSFLKSRIPLKNNLVMTDIGNLFEDLFVEEYISLEKQSTEFILKQNKDDKRLIEFELFSPNIVDKTIIRYIKLQELTSRIGGFINFLIILGNILLYQYNKFYFNNYIYYTFTNSNKDDEFQEFKFFLTTKEDGKLNNIILIDNNRNENFEKSEVINFCDRNKNILSQSFQRKNTLKLHDNIVSRSVEIIDPKTFTKIGQMKDIKNHRSLNKTLIDEETSNDKKEKTYFKIDDANKLRDEIFVEINNKIKANEEISISNMLTKREKSIKKIIENNIPNRTESYIEYMFLLICCCNEKNVYQTKVVDEIISFEAIVKMLGTNLVDKL